MKLSEVVQWVHDQGKWQTENCYKTDIDIIHNTLVIANFNTYGSKDNQECCMNTVLLDLDLENGYCRLSSVEVGKLDRKTILSKPFFLNHILYNSYCIEIDIDLGEKVRGKVKKN